MHSNVQAKLVGVLQLQDHKKGQNWQYIISCDFQEISNNDEIARITPLSKCAKIFSCLVDVLYRKISP